MSFSKFILVCILVSSGLTVGNAQTRESDLGKLYPPVNPDLKTCMLQNWGIPMYGSFRRPSSIEQDTDYLNFEKGFVPVGGIYDGQTSLFVPRLRLKQTMPGMAVVEILPAKTIGIPTPHRFRLVASTYQEYYQEVWECMQEELLPGDTIVIAWSGVVQPISVRLWAYWNRDDWRNPLPVVMWHQYFTAPGDGFTLNP